MFAQGGGMGHQMHMMQGPMLPNGPGSPMGHLGMHQGMSPQGTHQGMPPQGTHQGRPQGMNPGMPQMPGSPSPHGKPRQGMHQGMHPQGMHPGPGMHPGMPQMPGSPFHGRMPSGANLQKPPGVANPKGKLAAVIVREMKSWGDRCGHFRNAVEKDIFHDFTNLIEPVCTTPDRLTNGKMIGEGAFGSIVSANFTFPGKKEMKVAVKYLKQDQQLNSITTESKPMPVLFEELKHEVAALVAMKPHPHIAGLEGVVAKFPEEGDPCQQTWTFGLVFELCEGGDLNKLLHEDKKDLSDAVRLSMVRDVAAGLSHIHSVRLLHRDLSSRNLLITGKKQIKIADFGTARKVQSDKYEPDCISGSPPWMSPEQINGEDLSLKSDVFSLGSLLWEVATSKIPFSDTPMNDLDVIRATLNKPEPKMAPLGADDLKETEDEFREVYQRLISLCQQQDACFRPTAKAVHGILQALVSKPAEANGLLEAQEKRAVLGRKMFNFFVKHNQQRLSVLDGVIDHFENRVDCLNAVLLKKYKEDLEGNKAPSGPEEESTKDAAATESTKDAASTESEQGDQNNMSVEAVTKEDTPCPCNN